MNPLAQLGAEPRHHAVDDDQRRHAEHDADDADQRQVAGQQVAPAEEEFVHPVHLWVTPRSESSRGALERSSAPLDDSGRGVTMTLVSITETESHP